MKIQTSAEVTSLQWDGKVIDLNEHHNIDLEFSAIDTGGGFKDPMLDFSIPLKNSIEWSADQPNISLTLADPNNKEKQVSFSFSGEVTVSDQQINGRIKEDELGREVIGFVLNLLR
ncbi:hypothetical protein [Fodinibius sp.]|uniref:hypothetical protein n=1 Tax=Fodinibius sp. TaxID=1872440 RepID=UPI002ACF0339|nr:hypothetical protein [Fodinibius sp.]MDZ7658340.1 hypothetical protein [Fodinibius sp.]